MARRPLADDLADQILDDVLAGRYPVGTALPSESELAESASLSRPTVREAVKTLQAKGVLRIVHGRGTFVAPTEEWSVLDPTLLIARSAAQADSLLLPLKFIEARRLVEVGVAELAATRRSDDDISQLADSLAAMRKASRAKDVGAFVRADIRFHQIVLDAADNAFVAAIFDPLAQILRLTRYQTSAHAPVRRHAIVHHDNILRAVAAGSPEAARLAMHAHIVQTENDMVKYVRDPAAALTALRRRV
jgi:GntR family transcriptional regulator, transcriptional repressor for pyruvate dehydrogenase complex